MNYNEFNTLVLERLSDKKLEKILATADSLKIKDPKKLKLELTKLYKDVDSKDIDTVISLLGL